MDDFSVINKVATASNDVGDAGGVEKSYWYIAIVNHNLEKKIAEKLNILGVEAYLPIQTERRLWSNGRNVKVDRVILPTMIFIHCTESKRKEVVKLPFINRFMTNKAASTGPNNRHPLAIVPDMQIDTLKFMLSQSELPVTIINQKFKVGDKVKVIRGDLAGLEGMVINRTSTKSELTVALNFIGCAKVTLDTKNLQILS